MNGLGETVGELRRHLLDPLCEGDVQHCEEALGAMGDICDVLVAMDFPEAITGGLRRTTDAMRGILERTRETSRWPQFSACWRSGWTASSAISLLSG